MSDFLSSCSNIDFGAVELRRVGDHVGVEQAPGKQSPEQRRRLFAIHVESGIGDGTAGIFDR